MREPGEPQSEDSEALDKDQERPGEMRTEGERDFAVEANQFLHRIFREQANDQERLRVILERLEPFLAHMDNSDELRAQLERVIKGEDEESFVRDGVEVLVPLVAFAKEHPEEFEAIERQQFVEQGEFIPLSEVLAYEIEADGTVHIHFAPSRTLGFRMRSMVQMDLENLARIVQEDPDVERITATSWVVGEHPGLLEHLGFIVEGEISKEEHEAYFLGETRHVGKAFMDREEFLRRYLKEDHE